MTTRSFPLGLYTLVLTLCWLLPSSSDLQAKEPKSSSAYAEFRVNPTGKRETWVIVDVTQTKESTEVNYFQYFVTSTHEEGDFLMYHAITGSDTISKKDFKVLRNGKAAVLDTVLPVFDDEGGTDFEMLIQVFWVATGPAQNGTRPATAAIFVQGPFDSPYITDFIFPSDTASISQTK